jgi:hypothetical protein
MIVIIILIIIIVTIVVVVMWDVTEAGETYIMRSFRSNIGRMISPGYQGQSM